MPLRHSPKSTIRSAHRPSVIENRPAMYLPAVFPIKFGIRLTPLDNLLSETCHANSGQSAENQEFAVESVGDRVRWLLFPIEFRL
jgi:hypothetical protein